MIHTTAGQSAGWRIVAGFAPLIAGPLRRLLNVLESSPGQSAAILVSYCPNRSSELEETVTTKHEY